MVDKLPDKLQEDWLKLSFSITEEARREVVFRDLAQFVNRQAEMSASVFGKSSWERFDKSRRARRPVISATSLEKSKQLSEAPKNQLDKSICAMCGDNTHHVTACKRFLNLRHYKRLELVKQKGLCFCCLYPGHMLRCCSSQESCRVDGCSNPNHHQLLHKSNTARVNQESITTVLHSRCSQSSKEKKRLSLLPILPIRVSYGDKSETTYALLDTGSQQSFCMSKLAETLEAVGRKATMKLKTMN